MTLFSTETVRGQDVIEEIVVTGSRIDCSDVIPGRSLRHNAGNLLLRVRISNDSRAPEQRESEIHATLLNAIGKAADNRAVDLSTVTDSGFVVALTRANHRIELKSGSRPDTSQA